MSKTLNKFLKDTGYIRVKLDFLKTKHYSLEASINGINGRFILDTGASNSCICTSLENKFNVISQYSKEKASSANSEISNTNISKRNTIQIGEWVDKLNLITFEMNHINNALIQKKIDKIDGIIGADILKKSKSILDYETNNLYLKLWFDRFNYCYNWFFY